MKDTLVADVLVANVEVRPVTAEHAPAFHRALDVVARERRFLTFLEAPPADGIRAFLEGGISKGDPRMVAILDGDVVGWCDISRHHFPTHFHRGSLGMGVVPAFRGRGLGSRLIGAALRAAWAAGFTRIELAVYADNLPAIALYERVGFVREGFVRDAIRVDGEYRDAIAMALLDDDRTPNRSVGPVSALCRPRLTPPTDAP